MNAWTAYDEWEQSMTLSPETRDAVREGCKQSAAAVLPIVFDYLGGPPLAVLDVGAGEGWWTFEAQNLGVGVTCAQDTDSGGVINHWDAERDDELPMFYPKSKALRWPLALCLETAEHLTPAGGAHLLRELTRVSEAVLWSAAIPGQGGDGHINEAWPEHWAEGFDSLGWHLADPFRDRLWQVSGVEPWYRQNLLLAAPGRTEPDAWPRALVDPVTWAHHRGVEAP